MRIAKENNNQFCTPWKMYAEYEDGTSLYFFGDSEEDCMCSIEELTCKHGDCTYYTVIDDENYSNGKYIGKDNFIY